MVQDIMIAITTQVSPGMKIATPSGRAKFEIYHINSLRVMIHVGKKRSTIKIPAQCFEDVPNFLLGKGWVRIGAIHKTIQEDTFDSFVKQYTRRSAASYVAPILEKAGIIEIDRSIPAKVRLIS